MTYLYAFLYGAIVCAIAQIIVDNTKLTAGHLTAIYVVIGAFLAFINVYDDIISLAHAGASIPITSFGASLYKSAYEGIKELGMLGVFKNMLVTTSTGITSAIAFSFIFSLFNKSKD